VRFPTRSNPASSQQINAFKLTPSSPPTDIKEITDQWGNHVIIHSWSRPPRYVSGKAEYRVKLDRYLQRFKGRFPYPIQSIPGQAKAFLDPTDQIQSRSPRIRSLAKKLIGEAHDQVQAVTNVLSFVVDHIRYRVDPARYDALHTLESGIGNCQNYAHLAAALLRNQGVPARIVTGITAKKGWLAMTGTTTWNLTLGQGRHAWLEVYYPDFGWVGYDPQQTLNFVSTRHIAIEVGSDTRAASNDGTIVWASPGDIKPIVEETITINFDRDKHRVLTQGEQPAPRNNLFSSSVAVAAAGPEVPVEKPEKPLTPHHTLEEIKRFPVTVQRTFGNLDFPRVIDIFARDDPGKKGAKSLRRSFVSETAEYVTSKRGFAQKIEIPYPMRLYDISLALHKFGGQNGFIWMTVLRDEENQPGQVIAVSNKIDISRIGFYHGYRWIPFSLASVFLLPGRY
jgi:hypothetical protein